MPGLGGYIYFKAWSLFSCGAIDILSVHTPQPAAHFECQSDFALIWLVPTWLDWVCSAKSNNEALWNAKKTGQGEPRGAPNQSVFIWRNLFWLKTSKTYAMNHEVRQQLNVTAWDGPGLLFLWFEGCFNATDTLQCFFLNYLHHEVGPREPSHLNMFAYDKEAHCRLQATLGSWKIAPSVCTTSFLLLA